MNSLGRSIGVVFITYANRATLHNRSNYQLPNTNEINDKFYYSNKLGEQFKYLSFNSDP